MWGERRRREDECGSGEPVPISGQHFRLLAKTGVDCRRIFCSSLAQEIVMTSFGIRDWISRAGSAVIPAMAVLLSTDAAFASQGPGGGMGTASPLTQLAMAIIVYGASAIVVGAGLIGAARGR
jgi:hypothetical protein